MKNSKKLSQQSPKTSKPPKYSLPALRKIREKIYNIVVSDLGFFGIDLSVPGMNIRDMCIAIEREILGGTVVDEEELDYDDDDNVRLEDELKQLRRERLRALAGIFDLYREEFLTDAVLKDIAVHIAGNLEELKEGIPFKRWEGSSSVWAPVYILEAHRVYSRKRKKLYAVKMKAFGSALACMEWTSYITAGYLQRLIREGGCSKFGRYLPEDVSGMWFTMLISNSPKGMVYDEVTFSSSQQRHNKALQKARSEKCTGPFKPFRNQPCKMCPVGRDKCSSARLRFGYVKRECINKHTGYFDKDSDSAFCLACLITGNTIIKDQ